MKRRRFISFVFVLILCFGMSGCGKEKKTTAPNKFQSDYMEVWGGTTVEEGDFRVINGLLYYIDFETMEGIPICNKPNCRHISWKEDRNTKCDAANIDISTVFPYEGKLYGFRSLSDGGSELVVSDLDGGDWKSKGMFITAQLEPGASSVIPMLSWQVFSTSGWMNWLMVRLLQVSTLPSGRWFASAILIRRVW